VPLTALAPNKVSYAKTPHDWPPILQLVVLIPNAADRTIGRPRRCRPQDAIRRMASLSSMAPKQPCTVVPVVLNTSPAAPPTAMEVQIRLVLLYPYTGVSAIGPAADVFSLTGSLPGSLAMNLTFTSTPSTQLLTTQIFILSAVQFYPLLQSLSQPV
jgi:hypothetical protein